jgi:hypothetical protein
LAVVREGLEELGEKILELDGRVWDVVRGIKEVTEVDARDAGAGRSA